MVQLLYENEARHKEQFFEIQFLRNRLDSQLNYANEFTNGVSTVNRLCVGEPGNYGLIPIWGERSFVLFKMPRRAQGKHSAFLSMCTGRGGEGRRGKSGRGVKLSTDQFQIPFLSSSILIGYEV